MLAQLGAGPKSFLKADMNQPPPPPPPAPPPHAIKTLADCAAKAKTCKMANYISFSVKNADCSWYTKCNVTTGIGNPSGDYESEAIRPSIGEKHPGDPSHCACGVERRGEFGTLGSCAGCFLVLGSGLGLVGTVSARR